MLYEKTLVDAGKSASLVQGADADHVYLGANVETS